ncbi:hypothetical protein LTR66_001749 [Elasticomyces elasticus]|nr:hypothetical protein LTR66_001749 [Elasticomyces elasticus]
MMPPAPYETSWTQHLTIDTIALVLHRTLFHPFIASLIPLSLRAQATPYSHPAFVLASAYACLVAACHVLAAVNRRVAYGRPRCVDWEDEVVVITGGAGGLGRTLAQVWGMRGASVAVLDVREMDGEGMGVGVRWYACDVGDAGQVEEVKRKVEKDLGTPTILINNAGIVNGKPMLALSPTETERNFRINLLSHFHTIRAFLPAMLRRPNGGTIVTVASVLGRLGAANLSDYTAAKAGLIAMHASLRAELEHLATSVPIEYIGAANVKTVLVAPGQLSTPLFKGVWTPSRFLGPVVESVELARAIVDLVDEGMSGEISMPLYARWVQWLGVLPVGLQRVVRWLSGLDGAMRGFERGEGKQR